MRNKKQIMELVDAARQIPTNCGARFECGMLTEALEATNDYADVMRKLRAELQKAIARTTTQTFTMVREDGSVAKPAPNGGK